MTRRLFTQLAFFATGLALVVVVLGAYVRLSDAGLGCPDWPGCYGRLAVPAEAMSIEQASLAYPERPLETDKAWKEMVHRYFAGTLGLVILGLAVVAWLRRQQPGQQVGLPSALLALVIFQALLGMWTVTLLLKPVVVMAHLLGGLATLGLLWWVSLRHTRLFQRQALAAPERALRPWALLGLLVLGMQVALGGWTSANYAALQCTDFPTCQGEWWPPMDFAEGFVLWRGLGVDYEGGVLHNEARVAIHVAHRIGALVTLLYLGWLGLRAWRSSSTPCVRGTAAALLGLLLLQVSLGIANVVLFLPLPVAAAHNAGAALLLLSLITLNHVVRPVTASAPEPAGILRTSSEVA